MTAYREARRTALDNVQHEDRLFSDRIRNFLMATAFLVAAYASAIGDPALRHSVGLLGIVLSVFYLHIGVMSARGIRLWRATVNWSADCMVRLGARPMDVPEKSVRELFYTQYRKQPFWTTFGNTNAVQGLWAPASCLLLWVVLTCRALARGLGTLPLSSLGLWLLHVATIVWLSVLLAVLSGLFWVFRRSQELKRPVPAEELDRVLGAPDVSPKTPDHQVPAT